MTDAAPEAAGARELFVRHARRDGRSVAILRAVDYGDSCVIEAEVYPAGGRSTSSQAKTSMRGRNVGKSGRCAAVMIFLRGS